MIICFIKYMFWAAISGYPLNLLRDKGQKTKVIIQYNKIAAFFFLLGYAFLPCLLKGYRSYPGRNRFIITNSHLI